MTINSNILGFVPSMDYMHENQDHVYDDQVFLCYLKDRCPSFQFSLESSTPLSVTSVKLVTHDDEYEIKSELDSTGLVVVTEGDYQTLKFYSYADLSGQYKGVHWLSLTIDGEVYYSNKFNLVDQDVLDNRLKIEWWHNENMNIPEGFFSYVYPFKFEAYFDAPIMKPAYPYKKDVVERNSEELPVLRTSYKLSKFTLILPEYIIDAIRLIPTHDNVLITYKGRIYDVSFIEMNDPKWYNRGDIADVDFEFRSNTVVSTGGYSGIDSYLDSGCGCITSAYSAEASMVEGSREYANKRYFNIGQGQMVDLVEGDYVIIQTGVTQIKRLYQLDSSLNYVLVTVNEGLVVCDKNESKYYFVLNYGLKEPEITTVDDTDVFNSLVTGNTFPGAQNILYGKLQNGTIEEIGTFSYSELRDTVTVDLTDYVAIHIKPRSPNCSLGWSKSEWYQVQCYGIGCWVIGSTFIIT